MNFNNKFLRWGAFFLFSFLYILVFTKGWIGLHSDSVAYLSVAENIRAGRGLVLYHLFENTTPLANFPFFYALILSLGRSNIFPFLFVLNSFCLSVSLFMFYEILTLVAPRLSRLVKIILLICLISISPILYVHTMALTEPLFLAVSFSLLYVIMQGKLTTKKVIVLTVLSAILPLIRYAGVFVFLFVGPILLIEETTWIKKLKYLLLYAISVTPIAAWMYFLRSEGASSRQLVHAPLAWNDLILSVKTIFLWFIVDNRYILVFAGLGTLLFCINTVITNFSSIRNNIRSGAVLLWFGVSYYVFILASYLFFDRALASDYRRILVLLAPFLVLTFGFLLNYYHNRINLILVFALYFSVLTVHFPVLSKTFRNGAELSYYSWKDNSLLSYISANKSSYNFVSNAWEPLYAFTGIYVDRVPAKGEENRVKEQEYFNKALHLSKPLVLVYSKNHNKLAYLATPKTLSEYYDLELIFKNSDGEAYIIHQRK